MKRGESSLVVGSCPPAPIGARGCVIDQLNQFDFNLTQVGRSYWNLSRENIR